MLCSVNDENYHLPVEVHLARRQGAAVPLYGILDSTSSRIGTYLSTILMGGAPIRQAGNYLIRYLIC